MKILISDPTRIWAGKEEEEIVNTKEIKFVASDKTFEISITEEGNLKVRKSRAMHDQLHILPYCCNGVIIS